MFSTILNVDFSSIEEGKGFRVFTNNSCLLGSLFNKRFTPNILISFPKFKIKSLK